VLRAPVVVSAIIGASSVQQLEQNLGAVGGPDLTADELGAIEAVLG
jgi:L-glyceraldehyde 3-phosphate reductase